VTLLEFAHAIGPDEPMLIDQTIGDSLRELFSLMRDELAPHKTPKQWFAVDEFPMTGSGKIQKFVLCQQWENGDVAEL
jgi:acyl-coenzyme A synthetase/AMP-(fatty) acid ligase